MVTQCYYLSMHTIVNAQNFNFNSMSLQTVMDVQRAYSTKER